MSGTLPDLLRQRDRFLLTGHENPDGDCVGAEVALFHLLRAMGKQVVIHNPDPLIRTFDFLQRHTPFGHHRPDEPTPAHDVVVLLDCCQLRRVGALGSRLREHGAMVAVIDHHVGSEAGDGAVAFVDSAAPATGALVHRLHGILGVPLSPPAAEGVFLSLVSDTGWFRHSNTDAGVLALAAEMARAGVDVSRMFDLLYRRMHPDAVALQGRALAASQLRLEGRLGLCVLDRDLMEHALRTGFDTDLVLEPLRSIEGMQVVALLKERGEREVKLSLRATGDVDVQRIAAEFGGGGHRKAAGATVHLPVADVAARIEALVQAALGGDPGGPA